MKKRSLAVIGAGLSGSVCARRLFDAGWQVDVFDKSRGVGGRMATRRAPVTGADSKEAATELAYEFDHGAPGFSASSSSSPFTAWLVQSVKAGVVVPWPDGGRDHQWIATPDMPALCRWLLDGLQVHTLSTVDSLQRGPQGWSLLGDGQVLGSGFEAVLVAIPPAQAAALLQPHRADWAREAQAQRMSPRWTLMAISDEPAEPVRPSSPATGVLDLIVRQDAKPGRRVTPGRAAWVAHACAAWSQAHLEATAEAVLPVLQQELSTAVGGIRRWHHAVVHRWRYAHLDESPHSRTLEARDPAPIPKWDPELRLGVCGDAWGGRGGGGVEGAWNSAWALCNLF